VGFGAHVCYHCRISPPRFLAECRKRPLNQGNFVLLFFRLYTLSDLYLVFAFLFSCTALFVSISRVIGCEDRLQNDLYCVGWGVKLYSLTHSRNKDNVYTDICNTTDRRPTSGDFLCVKHSTVARKAARLLCSSCGFSLLVRFH